MPALCLTETKPRFRGVMHQYAFFVSLVTGLGLLAAAPDARARVAAAIYGVSLSALLGVSALYHRGQWSPRGRVRMRRLDHAMIFVLIAGTYTPFGLVAMSGPLASSVLAVIWGAALAGIALKLWWIDAPDWVSASLYLALGWVGVVLLPQLPWAVGWTATILLLLGGLLYSVGAAVYTLRRPDPVPAAFGYHEVFHALVVVAAGVQYVAVAACVSP